MHPLYRRVMAVLEAGGVPAPIRANIDSIFHSPDPSNGYNPDDYTPPAQYQPWLAAGSPTHDELGRELDVRGQLTGGEFSPYPNPDDPAKPPSGGGTERAPYINTIEAPAGAFPPDGLWRVSLPTPTDAAAQPITLPADWPDATLYCGDPGFAYMVVEVDGAVISNGTPQCAFPGSAGPHDVKVTLVDNAQTQAHGAGPVGIYLRPTP